MTLPFRLLFFYNNTILLQYTTLRSTIFIHLSNFRHLYYILCYNESMKEIKYSSKRRTHDRIKAAFAELLAEKKALNKITIAELAERANVTRGTFYMHFQNIFEVAEELENEFISTLDSTAEKMTSVDDFPFYLHQIFEFLANNEELYRQLLLSDAPMVFMYFYTLNILHQPNVRGLNIGAMGECALQYRRIWLEQ